MKKIFWIVFVCLVLFFVIYPVFFDDEKPAAETSTQHLADVVEPNMLEYDYYTGYEDGYERACEEIREEVSKELSVFLPDFLNEIEHEATDFACEASDCHPEDALCIIEDYVNQRAVHCNRVPTYSEFLDAVNSLMSFYDYFYAGYAREYFGDRYEY